jgi:hypothetical protein
MSDPGGEALKGVTEVRNFGLEGPGELFSFGKNSSRQIPRLSTLAATFALRQSAATAQRSNRSPFEEVGKLFILARDVELSLLSSAVRR